MKTFEELYTEYVDDIFRYIYLHVKNKQIAEDLTQDTFIKILHALSTYENSGSIKAWVFKIAKNNTYDYFRKQKWLSFFAATPEHNEALEDSILNKLEKDEDIRTLYVVIRSLKKDYQDVIILRKINEFSTKDTAEILNWTENKVKKKLERALHKLEETLLTKEEFKYDKAKRA